MNQNGYYPQGAQGYGRTGSSWPQGGDHLTNNQPNQQAGGFTGNFATGGFSSSGRYSTGQDMSYTTPQVPFQQGNANGFPQNGQAGNYAYGYPPQIPQTPMGQQSMQGQQSFGYPNPNRMNGGYYAPQQNPNAGSYIPQTPYSPGYTSPGYQTPGASQGYNAYGQMGKTAPQQVQPDYSQSIPLNGGGYIPQKVPIHKRPFQLNNISLLVIGALLVLLFALAVIVLNNTVLKGVFLFFAVGTTLILWVKPMAAENKRMTYSIIALALSVLTAVSLLMKQPADRTRGSTASLTDQEVSTSGREGGSEAGTVSSVAVVKQEADVTATPQATNDRAPLERLVTFFKLWNENKQDEMLQLCSPDWQSKTENPRTSLFGLLANRRPLDCKPESITGTDADSSRQVTVISNIDRNDGKKAETYRMKILMVKKDNEWYVDPQSLKTYENAETPDPNITPTPGPTDTPAVYSNTVLYYNPNKGEYYHLDPYCRVINEKYTPLQGQFTYAEINNEPYSKLKPCNACGAPLR